MSTLYEAIEVVRNNVVGKYKENTDTLSKQWENWKLQMTTACIKQKEPVKIQNYYIFGGNDK